MIMTEENNVYMDGKCVSDEPGLAFEINQLIDDANQLADTQAEVERLKLTAAVLNLRLHTSQQLRDDLEAEALRLREALKELQKINDKWLSDEITDDEYLNQLSDKLGGESEIEKGGE